MSKPGGNDKGIALIITLVLMLVLGVLGTLTIKYATKGLILSGGIKKSSRGFYEDVNSAISCLIPQLSENTVNSFILPYCLYASNDDVCDADDGFEYVKTDFCSSRQDICSECGIENIYVACPANNGGQRLGLHIATGEQIGKEGRKLAGFILLATFHDNLVTATKVFVQAPMRSVE